MGATINNEPTTIRTTILQWTAVEVTQGLKYILLAEPLPLDFVILKKIFLQTILFAHEYQPE